jgi:MFS family permease
VVALLLAVAPLPGAGRARDAAPARLRAAITRSSAWTAVAAFTAFLAVHGMGFLVAIRAADAFGVGPTARGLLLAGFGAAGVLAGRPAGALVDRFGAARVASAGAVAAAATVPLLGLVGGPGLLAGVWIGVGTGSAIMWAGLNTLTVQSAPANRAGAVSLIGAFKFTGNALAPVLFLPLYHVEEWLAFAAAGAVAATIAVSARAAAGPPTAVPARAARRPGAARPPAPDAQ